ncbi:hypothetical protein AB205_0046120 [Aquarana catesbeiana]|uniref:Protein kinase domain-containing protein n=1 Tax=Aquarana catesbeiana TaxID=8400 RepID=A0A2G9PCT7_AQUCT|nr:hypothetical protein AB205_0046120 [Aquarana catesbeiana]
METSAAVPTLLDSRTELIHLYLTGKDFNNLTTIYLAQHTPTGTSVTVRLTDLDDCSDEHIKYLQNEVVMSSFFRNPNILLSWKMFTVGTWLWVINPFMAYGSASSLMKSYYPEGMSEALIGNILYETLKGLHYLHQNGYIHRSVNGSHILISDEGLVSLSGLGHLYSMVRSGERAKVAYDFPNFSTAMLPWLSPELLRQDLYGYNVKSDIYSVGITACELATGRVPFMDMHRTQVTVYRLLEPHIVILFIRLVTDKIISETNVCYILPYIYLMLILFIPILFI